MTKDSAPNDSKHFLTSICPLTEENIYDTVIKSIPYIHKTTTIPTVTYRAGEWALTKVMERDNEAGRTIP